MNTAEQTVGALLVTPSLEIALTQRLASVMPWVSPESRAELERVQEGVRSLVIANRHLALRLAEAHDEINSLRDDAEAAA